MMRRELIPGWTSLSPLTRPQILYQPWNYNPHGGNDFWVEFPENLKHKKPVSGWCSYCAFGENINEEKVWSNVEFFDKQRNKIPIEYILLDDGWCEWGDWEDADVSKFSNGLCSYIKKIKKVGFEVGIWLSPFQVSPRSKLIQQYPGWLVLQNGKRVVSFSGVNLFGLKFGETKYLLDFKNPAVKKYIFSAIDRFIQEWNVGLVKLDYLYAPYFDPNFSEKEAAMCVRELLDYVRLNYPKIYTIGCGPLCDLVGRVDSAYVSENIILTRLLDFRFLNSLVHGERLRRLKKCLIGRKDLRGAFNFDPDVFVCSEATGFSELQIEELLQIIKNVNGNKFLGDDLVKLPQDRLEKYIFRLFE